MKRPRFELPPWAALSARVLSAVLALSALFLPVWWSMRSDIDDLRQRTVRLESRLELAEKDLERTAPRDLVNSQFAAVLRELSALRADVQSRRCE